MAFFTKGLLSGTDVTQSIGFGDQGFGFFSFNAPDQISKHLWFQNSTSEKTEVFEVERTHVQFDQGAGYSAGNRIAVFYFV